MELNLEEFNFNAAYVENRLLIFENSNYMTVDEATQLYDWLGKLLRKEKTKMAKAKKTKKTIVAKPINKPKKKK